VIQSLAGIGRFGLFSTAVFYRVVTPYWELAETARHVREVASRCALPVIAVIFPTGMVMALQGLIIFDLFGAQRLLSSLVSVAVYRELAPVLASMLVAAQGGSAFAAELGAMRIREELDATEIMAIDGLRTHVVPRVVAAMITAPILSLVGCLAGVLGGFTTAVLLKGQPSALYWSNLWDLTHPGDVIGGTFKSLVFGTLIGLIACYQGYNATGGAPGVGRAVNNTVVLSVTTFVIVNYFLTSAMFGAIAS